MIATDENDVFIEFREAHGEDADNFDFFWQIDFVRLPDMDLPVFVPFDVLRESCGRVDKKRRAYAKTNGIGETVADEGLAFSGISVVSPRLFPLLPEADHPYPVIDEYIRLSHEGHPVGAFIHPAEHWLDVGKPDTLEKAKQWTLSSDK